MPDPPDASSMPCKAGECDFHSEHPPCDRGWLDPDRVCPCWAARCRARVYDSNPEAGPASGAPMPGTVRAAWRTALKTGRTPSTVASAWIPAAEPAAAEPSGPDGPGPEPEPGPDPVVDELGTELTARQRTQLVAALNTARAAGHQDPELLALLHANTDPGRHPLKLWLHVLRNSDFRPAQIVLSMTA